MSVYANIHRPQTLKIKKALRAKDGRRENKDKKGEPKTKKKKKNAQNSTPYLRYFASLTVRTGLDIIMQDFIYTALLIRISRGVLVSDR